MRAVILGAGASGLLHALALRAFGVVVDLVFDPDETRARSLAELLGARSSTKLDAALTSSASVVAICGPPCVHVQQALAFGREGRVVLVEKPIATSEAELAALERNGGCVPVLQWRLGRALLAVRRAIALGELGPRPTVSVDLAWQRADEYFHAGRGSLRTWGCGALLSIGIHAVDAVLYALGGTARSVFGASSRREGVETETEACVVIVTDRGAMVSLRLTLGASSDHTRLSFSGAGVTATIRGTEEDPTTGLVEWSCADETRLQGLQRIERSAPGYTSGPLLVPLVGAALRPGADPRVIELPSIRSTAAAHRAVFALYERWGADERQAVDAPSEIDLAFSRGPGHSVSRACGFLDGPAPTGARQTTTRAESSRMKTRPDRG